MDSYFYKLILDRINMIFRIIFFLPHFPEENEETKSAKRRKRANVISIDLNLIVIKLQIITLGS